MPLEYYLGAAVAVIVLVLLVSAFTGKKKSKRRIIPVSHAGTDDLTRQLARAADALEAILKHLDAHPLQTPAATQTSIRPALSPLPQRAQAPPQAPASAPAESPRVAPERVVPTADPVITETPAAEPAVAAEAPVAASEQKPRRVKLSMFGR